MQITWFTVATGLIFSTIFAFILSKIENIKINGTKIIYFKFSNITIMILAVLVILRAFLLVDINGFTKAIPSYSILPPIKKLFETKIYNNLSVTSIFLFIWGVVSICRLGSLFIELRRKNIELAMIPEYQNEEIKIILQKIEERTDYRFDGRVIEYKDILVGASYWLGKKYIILPYNNEYTKEELFYLFFHEIAHLNYASTAYLLTEYILSCFFWFFPSSARKVLNYINELVCDQFVKKHLSDKEKEAYVKLIKDTSEYEGFISKNLNMFSSMNSHMNLNTRIQLIIRGKRTNFFLNTFVVFVAITLFVYSYKFTFQPAYYPDDELLFGGVSVDTTIEAPKYVYMMDNKYFLVSEDNLVIEISKEMLTNEYNNLPILNK